MTNPNAIPTPRQENPGLNILNDPTEPVVATYIVPLPGKFIWLGDGTPAIQLPGDQLYNGQLVQKPDGTIAQRVQLELPRMVRQETPRPHWWLPAAAVSTVAAMVTGFCLGYTLNSKGVAVAAEHSPTPVAPSTASSPDVTPTIPQQSGKTTATPSETLSASPTPSIAEVIHCPTPSETFIKNAPGEGKTVNLSFDDGPGGNTPEILQILKENQVPATFFFTGKHAEQNPEQVKAVAEAGYEIGNHTYGHVTPNKLEGGWTVDYLKNEIATTDKILKSSAGTGKPVCFFRPPGGNTTNVVEAAKTAKESGVLWSVDTKDWKQPASTTAEATDAIVKAAIDIDNQQHPIVLMHSFKASPESEAVVSSNRSNTVAALPKIIDWYKKHGYTFVRLDGTS